MKFDYDRAAVNTQNELTISVADLRDLVNASSLSEEDRRGELLLILQCIAHKNKLKAEVFRLG